MNAIFRIPRRLRDHILADLERPHPFAPERVGFVYCRVGRLSQSGSFAIVAHAYQPVADAHYERTWRSPAVFTADAFRPALQAALGGYASVFHVHVHAHHGVPAFSQPDLVSARQYVPDFQGLRPDLPHGICVLSLDSLRVRVWMPGAKHDKLADEATIVGYPLVRVLSKDVLRELA